MAPLIWNVCSSEFLNSPYALRSVLSAADSGKPSCLSFYQPPLSFPLKALSLTTELNTADPMLIVKVCEVFTLSQALPSTLHGLNSDSSQQLYEIGTIITILQRRKVRLKKLRNLSSSGPTTGKWQTRLGT